MSDKINKATEEKEHFVPKEKATETIEDHLGFDLESLGKNPIKKMIYYGR